MKTALRLFVSSATFGITIAAIYWLWAREPAGTILLGLMTAGFVFIAGYMLLAERDADLIGDRADAAIEAGAGERLGTFTLRSRWPILLAAAIALLLGGLVISPALAYLSALVMLAVLWELVRES